MSAAAGDSGVRVWVLSDDRAGHANQALGVAEALGLSFTVKPLAYNHLARLPNRLLGATMAHLAAAARAVLAPPWPELVIAAGRRTAPVARAIAGVAPATRLVQCMWPGAGARDFDLIAVPAHDSVPALPGVVRTLGAPHRVSAARLAEAEALWAPRLAALARPRLALLVGGATRRRRFTLAHARALAEQVAALAAATGAALMMTTSRRTPRAARQALLRRLAPAHAFDWSEAGAENPYLGYLALADAVVVTGDSTAMCTEACAGERPVHIFAPPAMTAAKHRALHAALYARGSARPLAEAVAAGSLGACDAAPLDDAATVAAAIRARLRIGGDA